MFHYNHLEFEMTRMSSLITEYTNDYDLVGFSAEYPVLSGYEVSVRMNEIHRKLRQVQQSSPYIEDVIYYVPVIGKKISALSYISSYQGEELHGLLESRGNLQSSISLYDGSLYYTMSIPYSMNSLVEPNFLLAFKINTKEMIRTLNGFTETSVGGASLLFGKGMFTLNSDGLSETDTNILLSDNGMETKELPDEVRRLESENNRIYTINNEEFGIQLAEIIPKSTLQQPIEIYTRWLWIITIFSLLVIVLFSYWIIRLIYRPLGKLTTAFKVVEFGRNGKIRHNRKDEFGFLYTRFNDMLERLHLLIEENYLQRIRSQDAELKQLQSQITPHFLYNSLFTIKQMAELEDVDGIKEFSDYLGQYFQYITRNAAQDVYLEEDVVHAVNYMSLQEIRFAPRIAIIYEEIPKTLQRFRVPRLILQPIVENGFEHGVKQNKSKGLLRLSFHLHENSASIIVEDNGENLTDSRLSQLTRMINETSILSTHTEITGLLNVHKRMVIRYGAPYGVSISRSELGGMRVEIRMPIEEVETDVPTADC
ncbi:sensor histidine kinase [Paenibacillus sp. YIM B09110]|uniref:sensor histidine kinase n=1 Tax=Paenibacillus sp. YIM B09110 TaxID=3126102 RepID=UPI00301D0A8C